GVQLQKSGPELVIPWSSVKLSCKASDYTFTDSYIYWLKQRPEQSLEWKESIDSEDGENVYAQKFQSKATLTADTSSNTVHMQFSSLTSEDAATYFMLDTVLQPHPECDRNARGARSCRRTVNERQ
uniref:Ig-like domain-containing protein n=1 Tax=Rattus norvegicus TaxID=10116 RepID=A0ABK0LKZ2_RAT